MTTPTTTKFNMEKHREWVELVHWQMFESLGVLPKKYKIRLKKLQRKLKGEGKQ